MFPGPSLQIIKDCITVALDNDLVAAADRDEAADIAAFCDTNIKAVCPECGGTGMDPDTGTPPPPCNTCRGTGMGPSFQALSEEMGRRNAAVQKKVQTRLKERKHGKQTR